MTLCINGVTEVELPAHAVEAVLESNPNAALGPCPAQPVVDDMPQPVVIEAQPQPPVGAPSVDGVEE